MPLSFLAIVIAGLDLPGRGNLRKPVGHGRLGYHTEVIPLHFSPIIASGHDDFWRDEATSL
jgi:hypothetical protein